MICQINGEVFGAIGSHKGAGAIHCGNIAVLTVDLTGEVIEFHGNRTEGIEGVLRFGFKISTGEAADLSGVFIGKGLPVSGGGRGGVISTGGAGTQSKENPHCQSEEEDRSKFLHNFTS
ncbi:hypothetical protein SDC9_208845 [bioreactor metagenome]|uniref:Uncharacterized protein n=1 Tax=bioreactor metagenome TaxID=1076179 RepID=A0A645JBS7_9ZZZZ